MLEQTGVDTCQLGIGVTGDQHKTTRIPEPRPSCAHDRICFNPLPRNRSENVGRNTNSEYYTIVIVILVKVVVVITTITRCSAIAETTLQGAL